MDACTIVARNYLPHARALAESFRMHHPEGSFTVLVIDADLGELSEESSLILSPYEIGLPRDEFHRMALIYDVKELATAVKPFLLRRLLRDHDHVAYFDPDIEVFAPLDDVAELARGHGIVLTPHVTKPLPRDHLLPSEEMLMSAGIYNLGFIAVGESATSFLDWWCERLARDCIVDVARGLFVDQRWVDFVPGMYPHYILRDPGCNVAYWNLSYRRVTRDGARYTVDGVPLRFFHYSGFDPSNGRLLSTHMGTLPRILLEDQHVVRELCDAYVARLRTYGLRSAERRPYRFDSLPDGTPIDDEARRDVRETILAAERRGERACPDPFDARSTAAFLEWLAASDGTTRLPRYFAAVYRQRADVRAVFPAVRGADRQRFLSWVAETRARRPGVAAEVLRLCAPRAGAAASARSLKATLRAAARRHGWLAPAVRAYRLARRARNRVGSTVTSPAPESSLATVPRFPPLPGVNVIGYLRAELGVGEAARRLLLGLEEGAIPHVAITYRRTDSRQEHPIAERRAVAAYDTNVVCVNADQLPIVHDEAPELFEGRYTIGLWFWEVSTFPETFQEAFDLVDEVWVGSEFVRCAVGAQTSKPVHVVPLPVDAPSPHGLSRAAVGLTDRFTFLFSFDVLSVLERKNPQAVIEAFSRAFEPGEGPRLLVKSINGAANEIGLEDLCERAAGRPDISIVDGYVSAAERDALMALCDCYVSLHRSEGYGLTMAEAMASGKPVIATAYSGNLEFMDHENSLLVPYELTSVPPGCPPYPPWAEWAEPDLDVAARHMRYVWEHQEEARRLGARAQEHILRGNAPRRTAQFVAERLAQIRTERGLGPADPVRRHFPGSALLDVPGRPPTRFLRRVLHRLLWPYLVEREEFDAAVVAVLRGRGHLPYAAPLENGAAERDVTEDKVED